MFIEIAHSYIEICTFVLSCIKDFAGSNAVHTIGGAIALIGIIILGSRKDRRDEAGKFSHPPAPHNVPVN